MLRFLTYLLDKIENYLNATAAEDGDSVGMIMNYMKLAENDRKNK